MPKDPRIPDISRYSHGRLVKPRPGPTKLAKQKAQTKRIRDAYRREAKAKTAHERAQKELLRIEAVAKRANARASKAEIRLKKTLKRIAEAPTPAGATRLADMAFNPEMPETIRAKAASLLIRFAHQPAAVGRRKGEKR